MTLQKFRNDIEVFFGIHTGKHIFRSIGIILASGCLVLAGTASNAQQSGQIPFGPKTIMIKATGQPVSSVLEDLFGQAGLKVKISPGLNKPINGEFPGSPKSIWEQLSRSFNLVGYYDGSAVRVYSANDIKSVTVATEFPAEVVREASRLGMLQGVNAVRQGKNNVIISGVPIFVDRVSALAKGISAPVQPSVVPITVTPASSGSSDIMSPMVQGGARTQPVLSSYGRSQLLQAVGPRNPYEIRIFSLNFASAEDKIKRTLRGDVIIPGAATLLQKTMGDGRFVSSVTLGGNGQRSGRGNGTSLTPEDPEVSSRYKRDGYQGAPTILQPREPKDVDGPRITAYGKKQLYIKDRPEAMRVYAAMIDNIDIEKRQLEIEVTILEYNTDYNKELGLSAGINFGGFSAAIGGPSSEPRGGLSEPNIGGGYTKANKDFVNLQVNLMEKNGWARVVLRPRSVTMDDEATYFSTGLELPSRVSADRDAQLFIREARLGVEVYPRIIDEPNDLRIGLDILIIDGKASTNTADGIIIEKTELNPATIVRQGEAMIIGGITVDNEFDNRSKVPGFSAVPVVGELFKKRRKGTSRIEKIYIITPRIMGTGTPYFAPVAAAQQQPPVAPVASEKKPKSKKTSSKRRDGN